MARKKIFAIYIGICVIFSLFTLLLYNFQKTATKTNTIVFDESMLVRENFINGYSAENNKVLIFLSLDCEHCTNAIDMIKQNKKNLLKSNSFVFIFNEEKRIVIDFFVKNRDLFNDNIYVYNDADRRLYRKLGVSSYPTVFQLQKNIIINSGNATAILPRLLVKDL